MVPIDIIKYFARYPLLEGVVKNFAREDDTIPGYADLKAYISAMDPNSLIPELTDFVVYTNDKKLAESIAGIDGYFLLVEPGGIGGGPMNEVRVRDSKMTVQLTIASHWTGSEMDSMGEMLQSSRAFEIMTTLINFLKKDDRENCPVQRWLDNPFQLDPIDPFWLCESIGWQLVINVNYMNLL